MLLKMEKDVNAVCDAREIFRGQALIGHCYGISGKKDLAQETTRLRAE